METQDFNKELLDYLYGEMSMEEKKAFETKMEENAQLKREFNELSSVRQELDNLKDKEVMEPFSTARRKTRSTGWLKASPRNMIVFRPVTAVAASLLVLMLVGYLTNFSLSITKQGVYIGYTNQRQTSQENFMSANEVRELVNQEVRRNNEVLLTKLTSNQQGYEQKFASLESSIEQAIISNDNAIVTQDDLEKFFIDAENSNKELMKEYLKLTSAQQQEYFKTMLTQFNEFIQEQRNEDLTLIRNSLIDIKQSQNLQKLETDQAIASLFTSVNQRSN